MLSQSVWASKSKPLEVDLPGENKPSQGNIMQESMLIFTTVNKRSPNKLILSSGENQTLVIFLNDIRTLVSIPSKQQNFKIVQINLVLGNQLKEINFMTNEQTSADLIYYFTNFNDD